MRLRATICILSAALLGPLCPFSLPAAEISGTYKATFSGVEHFTERSPASQRVSENATFTVQCEGGRAMITMGSIGAVLPDSTFEGVCGNERFSAIRWYESDVNEAEVIWAQLSDDTLKGMVVFPRVAKGRIPGWTELTFSATRTGSSSAKPSETETSRASRWPRPSRPSGTPTRPKLSSPRPPRSLPSGPSSSTSSATETFEIETNYALNPEAPTSKDRVSFELQAVGPPGVLIERSELWMNAHLIKTVEGNRVNHRAGPFRDGQTSFQLIAHDAQGRRAVGEMQYFTVYRSGTAVVAGRITGVLDSIRDIQLVDEKERVLQRTQLSSSGRYRFEKVPATRVCVFINTGKADPSIRVTKGGQCISSNGSWEYEINFEVR